MQIHCPLFNIHSTVTARFRFTKYTTQVLLINEILIIHTPTNGALTVQDSAARHSPQTVSNCPPGKIIIGDQCIYNMHVHGRIVFL